MLIKLDKLVGRILYSRGQVVTDLPRSDGFLDLGWQKGNDVIFKVHDTLAQLDGVSHTLFHHGWRNDWGWGVSFAGRFRLARLLWALGAIICAGRTRGRRGTGGTGWAFGAIASLCLTFQVDIFPALGESQTGFITGFLLILNVGAGVSGSLADLFLRICHSLGECICAL